MSEQPDLAGLAWPAAPGGPCLLMQAATPTEARLIRDRIAAAGGTAAAPVSLGPPGDLDAELLAEVTGRGDDTGWSRSGWPGCPRSTRAGVRPG
jgi:3-hydroxyisobutyrate dehydrogenase-like beta-hydroxyacid dehydrogenase